MIDFNTKINHSAFLAINYCSLLRETNSVAIINITNYLIKFKYLHCMLDNIFKIN